MTLRIKHGGFLTPRLQLRLRPDGVKWIDTGALFAHWRHFRFDEIDYVLMSPDHRLTLQAGRTYFTIPTRPDKRGHQEFLQELLRHLQRSNGSSIRPC